MCLRKKKRLRKRLSRFQWRGFGKKTGFTSLQFDPARFLAAEFELQPFFSVLFSRGRKERHKKKKKDGTGELDWAGCNMLRS